MIFASLSILFRILVYGPLTRTHSLDQWHAIIAKASSMTLNALGVDAVAYDSLIRGESFTMHIAAGCDSLLPTSLYVFAVVATPVAWTSKLPGILAGVALLFIINIARIASLYLVGAQFPEWFDVIHENIWHVGYIMIGLLIWILWAIRSVDAGQPH